MSPSADATQHTSGLAGPASGGDARTANTKPASEHEPAAADEATLTPVKAGQASQQGEGGGEDAPAFLADTIRQDDPADAVVGGTQPVSDRSHSEPGNGQTDGLRICPRRDAVCPHGMSCTYWQADMDCSTEPQPSRRTTMTPLEPRNAGGLKGFGFTVKFDDVHEPVQPVTEGGTTIPHHGTVRA